MRIVSSAAETMTFVSILKRDLCSRGPENLTCFPVLLKGMEWQLLLPSGAFDCGPARIHPSFVFTRTKTDSSTCVTVSLNCKQNLIIFLVNTVKEIHFSYLALVYVRGTRHLFLN